MAKIEKITYQCDVCKTEYENEKDMTSTIVPCYGGERNEYHTECRLDLCLECSKKLREVIYQNFAHITDYYGLQITKVK